jgi:PIN domain nuclease of toxin-antitoxin system
LPCAARLWDGFASEEPADRFTVATALELNLTLVTAEGAMRDFKPVTTLW